MVDVGPGVGNRHNGLVGKVTKGPGAPGIFPSPVSFQRLRLILQGGKGVVGVVARRAVALFLAIDKVKRRKLNPGEQINGRGRAHRIHIPDKVDAKHGAGGRFPDHFAGRKIDHLFNICGLGLDQRLKIVKAIGPAHFDKQSVPRIGRGQPRIFQKGGIIRKRLGPCGQKQSGDLPLLEGFQHELKGPISGRGGGGCAPKGLPIHVRNS